MCENKKTSKKIGSEQKKNVEKKKVFCAPLNRTCEIYTEFCRRIRNLYYFCHISSIEITRTKVSFFLYDLVIGRLHLYNKISILRKWLLVDKIFSYNKFQLTCGCRSELVIRFYEKLNGILADAMWYRAMLLVVKKIFKLKKIYFSTFFKGPCTRLFVNKFYFINMTSILHRVVF